jgi:hypothetical protein
MVEKVVPDVDAVVSALRFDGWQDTRDGDRSVRQALMLAAALSIRSAYRAGEQPKGWFAGLPE